MQSSLPGQLPLGLKATALLRITHKKEEFLCSKPGPNTKTTYGGDRVSHLNTLGVTIAMQPSNEISVAMQSNNKCCEQHLFYWLLFCKFIFCMPIMF